MSCQALPRVSACVFEVWDEQVLLDFDQVLFLMYQDLLALAQDLVEVPQF